MSNSKQGSFVLSDKTYNATKRLVQVILPAFSALYFGLAAIWGLPAAEEVVGTIAVITTFLGVSLGISSAHYAAQEIGYDGSLIIKEPEEGPKIFSLELDGDPEEIAAKESIAFKVKNEHDLIKDEPL